MERLEVFTIKNRQCLTEVLQIEKQVGNFRKKVFKLKIRKSRTFIVEYLANQVVNKNFVNAYNHLGGLTGAATAEVISNCVGIFGSDFQYLEVGIYQACNLSLVANSNPNVSCFGVDNFSEQFEENLRFKETTEEVVKDRINRFCPNNCAYKKEDFRDFFSKPMPFDKKIGVYFFDGPHSLQDQMDGVEMALPYLADQSLIFIDDLASENVQESYVQLMNKYTQLTPIAFLTAPGNIKQHFNQGQIVLEFNRCG